MRSLRIVAAGIAAFALAPAASAQIAPGRSGSSTMTYYSGKEVLADALSFGECYAKARPERSLRLIATEPGSREEAQTYVALFKKGNQGCMGDLVELRLPLAMIRGGIAEGLLKGRVPIPPELKQTAPARAQVRNLGGAARCYIVAHRPQATRLVDSLPGSRKEFDAVMALMPEFRKCVPNGARAQFSPTLVRFRIAEALLRTSAPAAPTGGQ
jgi:hypothetical protein